MTDHKIIYQGKLLPKKLESEYIEIYDNNSFGDFSIFGITEYEEFRNIKCTDRVVGKFYHVFDKFNVVSVNGLTYLRPETSNAFITLGEEMISSICGDIELHVFFKAIQSDTDSIHAIPILITTEVDLS